MSPRAGYGIDSPRAPAPRMSSLQLLAEDGPKTELQADMTTIVKVTRRLLCPLAQPSSVCSGFWVLRTPHLKHRDGYRRRNISSRHYTSTATENATEVNNGFWPARYPNNQGPNSSSQQQPVLVVSREGPCSDQQKRVDPRSQRKAGGRFVERSERWGGERVPTCINLAGHTCCSTGISSNTESYAPGLTIWTSYLLRSWFPRSLVSADGPEETGTAKLIDWRLSALSENPDGFYMGCCGALRGVNNKRTIVVIVAPLFPLFPLFPPAKGSPGGANIPPSPLILNCV
ncbi:hypothetical protein QBC45DRAFT_436785 [Copromyces sp. CBS 386.78]|nr:hypothetical protein QBC45DRAFT_436785 [Copromyces sp. CBS 386.78]